MIDRIAEVAGRPVSRETVELLTAYVALLTEENCHQNLVSVSTIGGIWDRHILDSAQLLRFAPFADASWADIGAGAGLPGIVLACLTNAPVTLIEPRRLRAEFLERVVHSLGLQAQVVCAKAQRAEGKYDVITARAVAPLSDLFEFSHHLSTGNTRWVLPKGKSAQTELADAQRAWQGTFHVEQSLTDEASKIIVATGVSARK